ncbi:MAG TPA: DinB family protein [Vicinamibacteria bacterium]|jgi:uncharacterized damage-inducible protein DinB
MQLSECLLLLQRTPAVLSTLLDGLPDDWVHADEGPETFSAHDVVGHLIHGEETDWLPRIRIVLEHGESRPFDPFDRFAFRERNRGVPLRALLDRFARRRDANLTEVRGLGLADRLALTGTHPGLGRVTLGELLASWVVHDLGHLAQAARVLAKHHRADVGPWVEYMRILDPR